MHPHDGNKICVKHHKKNLQTKVVIVNIYSHPIWRNGCSQKSGQSNFSFVSLRLLAANIIQDKFWNICDFVFVSSRSVFIYEKKSWNKLYCISNNIFHYISDAWFFRSKGKLRIWSYIKKSRKRERGNSMFGMQKLFTMFNSIIP